MNTQLRLRDPRLDRCRESFAHGLELELRAGPALVFGGDFPNYLDAIRVDTAGNHSPVTGSRPQADGPVHTDRDQLQDVARTVQGDGRREEAHHVGRQRGAPGAARPG